MFYEILGCFYAAILGMLAILIISTELDHWKGRRKQNLIPGTVKGVTRERPTQNEIQSGELVNETPRWPVDRGETTSPTSPARKAATARYHSVRQSPAR